MDKLHECKRGLATATPQDYNDWWRERERLRAEVRELREILKRLESEFGFKWTEYRVTVNGMTGMSKSDLGWKDG